jgi:hypothetical protein
VEIGLSLGIVEPDLSHIERAALLSEVVRLTAGEGDGATGKRAAVLDVLKQVPFFSEAVNLLRTAQRPAQASASAAGETPLGAHVVATAAAYQMLMERGCDPGDAANSLDTVPFAFDRRALAGLHALLGHSTTAQTSQDRRSLVSKGL